MMKFSIGQIMPYSIFIIMTKIQKVGSGIKDAKAVEKEQNLKNYIKRPSLQHGLLS